MAVIRPNSVLPAKHAPFTATTIDGQTVVGEIAVPLTADPIGTIVCLHPLSTHGGSSDSHLFRKAAWRLPALAAIAVVRFNFRGVSSSLGMSTGQFGQARAEGLDLGAVMVHAASFGLPDPWLVGWSFGSDVVLRHGAHPPVLGAVLISPTLRWSTPPDMAAWADYRRPFSALIPQFDDYLRPDEAARRFAAVPQAEVIAVPKGRHLFVGEEYVKIVLDHIAQRVAPGCAPLPSHWDGPMQSWSVS